MQTYVVRALTTHSARYTHWQIPGHSLHNVQFYVKEITFTIHNQKSSYYSCVFTCVMCVGGEECICIEDDLGNHTTGNLICVV